MTRVICDMSMSLDGPLGDTPCFVVTHHAPERSHPSIYTFVTDGVATAIEQAKQTAGDKKVSLFGATVMQQALPRAASRAHAHLTGHDADPPA